MKKFDYIKKVRALLEVKEERGATLAETIAALKASKKIMATHGITEEEILNANDSEGIVFASFQSPTGKMNTIDEFLGSSIAKFTGTVSVKNISDAGGEELVFFGYKPDVELATIIRERIIFCASSEWAKISEKAKKEDYSEAIFSFAVGFSHEVGSLLESLSKPVISNGKDLVVLKNQMIISKLSKIDESFEGMSGEGQEVIVYTNHEEYTKAGRQAGKNARFLNEVEE